MSIVNPQNWLKLNWPNCKALDHDWTMERYDYPQEVRDWIKENWVKVSDNNGGTYHEPQYHKNKGGSQPNQKSDEKSTEKSDEKSTEKSAEKSAESTKNFEKNCAKTYQKTVFGKGMDKANKKALNIMATQGSDAAIAHMFTHPENGRALSYGEMRMFYG